jgi:flagellar FliJ protein
MAFKFSLAAVLKYREELEKREERILEECRDKLARLETKLTEVKAQLRQLDVERESLLRRGLLGDDLHYVAEQKQQFEGVEKDMEKQVSSAVLDYDKQMEVFLAARQKWKILDELKSKQKSVYSHKQERQEQQNVDEIFIARFKRDT